MIIQSIVQSVFQPIARSVIDPLRINSAFSPLSLFKSGEQGTWYDPSDLTTLFQDSAGTTPVTASGQPVGLMKDKSGRGNHATQSTATKRPTFRDVGGLRYLECDGMDDGMVTNSIDFTGTDKVSVFAGVRKLSDAATGALAELSTDAAANTRAFVLFAPSNVGVNKYNFRSLGTTGDGSGTASIRTPVAPTSNVVTGVGAIPSDTCLLRVDGVQVATTAADQGTGNYGNYPLYLFRRGGTSLPFNGWFYGLVITGRLTTDAETAATERLLATNSGVTL